MKNDNTQTVIVTITIILAFVVVVVGAYTRLTNAGLGCPDWPGCYGKMIVPSATLVKQSHQVSLDKTAAWTEMKHRYLAGSVLLFVVILNFLAWWRRRTQPSKVALPTLLLLLVCGQALFGMWTVTLKLHPAIVTMHLLGGLTVLSLLWVYRLQLSNKYSTTLSTSERRWQSWSLFGLVLLIIQIALGGWVSSNYAGLACTGFPTCNGEWLPQLNISKAFSLPSIGLNFEGGLLDSATRVSIQMVHRVGAVIVGLYLLGFSAVLLKQARSYRIKKLAIVIASMTAIQFILGIINVTHLLPLNVAVCHNAVAALLLLALVTLCCATIANRGEWFHG